MSELMLFPVGIRDWARRLIASQIGVDPVSTQRVPATLRVYDKLRRRLCAPIGVAGFQALASRALSLAKSQYPKLAALQVAANGGLCGFEEVDFQLDTDEDIEVGVLFIAQLLELFLTLLGEATTVRLVADAGLQLEVKTNPDAMGPTLSATATSYFEPFESLLLEAERLRGMSKRLEGLAGKHAGIEEVTSLAENIRNIATVLDVFTLIRSKDGNLQGDADSPATKGYVN